MEPKAALQRAAEELARQRVEIESLRRDRLEPIAIVGMACRLPGADSPEAFWSLLDRGGDAVTEVPRDRWNASAFYDADPSVPGKMATRQGAFIRNADTFDAPFFGIAPREAQSLDPQQRVLLETVWQALEQANIAPPSLYGSATAVFVGITCFDHAIRMSESAENFNSYAGTGSALNMAAGRISYVLGLTGPSMAVDTACSSSLVCLHLACQNLRLRESNAAIVGGVHLILSPHVMVSFSQARMLAADGRSKTFDASADGYSRGEGCGVVVLKRLSDAIAERDTILGVIRGTAVNQDGPSGGLTVPNGASQQQVIARALATAGVEPAAVAYVEAHGTGTPLGDPIEVEALARVYGKGRAAGAPLLVGSAKTNIGHLEPAAGMAGLIKILLAFRHGRIPRHLHFQTPNPHIPWGSVPVKVASEAVEWPRSSTARLAGLSGFGFSGTNAHVIIEEPPVDPRPVADAAHSSTRLLPLSAKDDAALRELAARYARVLADEREDFAAICHTAGAGRAHFPHRLAVIASTATEAKRALEEFLAGTPSGGWRSGKAANAAYRRDARDVKARLARIYDAADANATADLYLEGVAIEWDRLFGASQVRCASLPTYPFQRQRYWIETRDQLVDAAQPFASSLYEMAWPKIEAPLEGARIDAGRRWTIVDGDRAMANGLRHEIVQRGGTAAITTVTDAAASGATDIVFTTAAREPRDAGDACAQLLAIVQALLTSAGPLPRIWIVTRGAVAAAGPMHAAGAAHAPLAAFARVVGLEHPELFGRLIDLDPAAADSGAAALLDEILRDDTEDQVAIRNGERYAPRVDYANGVSGGTTRVRADGTYLITGGLGRLGLHTARWLSSRGARHLWLLGRTGVTTAEQRAQVAALEADGTRVRIAIGDASDRNSVTTLVREIGAEAPLRGVVHAAGLPGWIDLADLTAEALAEVLRPKVDGAWALHEATAGVPLDFFVCFSSIASAWGSRGQAHYAAGNAFLDALAHVRRGAGLPAVTINWGPWVDGGMSSPEAEALLRRVGVRPLVTATALAALDALAAGDRPQVVVADIDWTLFKGSYEARGHRRLLERLKTAGAAAGTTESDLARQIAAAPESDRERLLAAAVQAEVAQVLALPAAAAPDLEQGLFEMGMDSLMALELRTRLQTLIGRALPATLVFDCPTIAAIARFILAELSPAPAAAAASPARTRAAVTRASADLDALSEEDAETLLLKKLESIH